jgi:uncharacterized repeat protein (TIGR04076 family)
MAKATSPKTGQKILATVIDIKGRCTAGHEIGDKFDISCHRSAGLCGFFYHDLFPRLAVMEFGGRYPWWDERQTSFEYECPDKKNLLTMRLEIASEEGCRGVTS